MKKTIFLSMTAGAVLLAGCADVKQSLGLDRSAPDAFAVVSRAPLEVPPSYDLRPPIPGAERPQEPAMREKAAAELFGAAPQADGDQTFGERQLLSKAGAGAVDPDIRPTLAREAGGPVSVDRTLLEKILATGDDTIDPVIDPDEERQRIDKRRKAGESLDSEGVPVIESRGKTVLDGIFD
ncbi:MAG: DUF3035 domain-containing protein [Pseudomonadota bacterium]|nr:DUF3035 domain-containing protein [Pseudomonadota bacterium]